MERYKIKGLEGEFERILEDMCYDRSICEFLEVDYVNIREEDLKKIRDYILEIYEVRQGY